MTPKSETLAFRIWALCQPRGWGMTVKDCAEELGVDWQKVRNVVAAKKWSDRFKATTSSETYLAARFALSRAGGGFDPREDTRAAIADLVGPHRREAAE